MVISAMRRDFSAVRITLLLKVSPRNLDILLRPASTSLRMAGVISNCLPVYSTFIVSPPLTGVLRWPWSSQENDTDWAGVISTDRQNGKEKKGVAWFVARE